MLDVQSRNHIDAGIQEFHHVFPTLRIARTLHIRMRQLIDDDQLGMDLQNGLQIHLLDFLSFIKDFLAGNHGQTFEHGHRSGTTVSLHITDLHVYSVLQQVMRLRQHPVSLAYTGYHSDINLELTPSGTTNQFQKPLRVTVFVFFHILLLFKLQLFTLS